MLMASRLIYGMARQHVLPRSLGRVLPGRRSPWAGIAFSTVLAMGLIWYVSIDPSSNIVANLSGTTAFLLLCVFTLVNVACVVLRRKRDPPPEGVLHFPGTTAVGGSRTVCLPRWSMGGQEPRPVPSGWRPHGHRRGAVVHHLADHQEDQHQRGRTSPSTGGYGKPGGTTAATGGITRNQVRWSKSPPRVHAACRWAESCSTPFAPESMTLLKLP